MPIKTDKLFVNEKELILVKTSDDIPAGGGTPLLTLEEHMKLAKYLRDRQTWIAVADADAGGGTGTNPGGTTGGTTGGEGGGETDPGDDPIAGGG